MNIPIVNQSHSERQRHSDWDTLFANFTMNGSPNVPIRDSTSEQIRILQESTTIAEQRATTAEQQLRFLQESTAIAERRATIAENHLRILQANISIAEQRANIAEQQLSILQESSSIAERRANDAERCLRSIRENAEFADQRTVAIKQELNECKMRMLVVEEKNTILNKVAYEARAKEKDTAQKLKAIEQRLKMHSL